MEAIAARDRLREYAQTMDVDVAPLRRGGKAVAAWGNGFLVKNRGGSAVSGCARGAPIVK
jgi:hypothetical protein